MIMVLLHRLCNLVHFDLCNSTFDIQLLMSCSRGHLCSQQQHGTKQHQNNKLLVLKMQKHSLLDLYTAFEHCAMFWAAWLIAEMCYTLLSSARGADFSPSRFRQSSRAPVMGFPPFQASQVAVISEMQADRQTRIFGMH